MFPRSVYWNPAGFSASWSYQCTLIKLRSLYMFFCLYLAGPVVSCDLDVNPNRFCLFLFFFDVAQHSTLNLQSLIFYWLANSNLVRTLLVCFKQLPKPEALTSTRSAPVTNDLSHNFRHLCLPSFVTDTMKILVSHIRFGWPTDLCVHTALSRWTFAFRRTDTVMSLAAYPSHDILSTTQRWQSRCICLQSWEPLKPCICKTWYVVAYSFTFGGCRVLAYPTSRDHGLVKKEK